ncbi:MAG: hypothetical protein CMO81_00925 [Waddliaceae bacterium]|nr:hypothetical protein [Waddliaceae bacterium]
MIADVTQWITMDLMRLSWEELCDNADQLMIDPSWIDQYQDHLEMHLDALRINILRKEYKAPHDPNCGIKQIDFLLAQEVARQLLLPFAQFWVLESGDKPSERSDGILIDIRKLLSQIPTALLMRLVRHYIETPTLLTLIAALLENNLMHRENLHITLPSESQGSMLSALLVDLTLHALFGRLHHKGYICHRHDREIMTLYPPQIEENETILTKESAYSFLLDTLKEIYLEKVDKQRMD